MAAAAAGAAAAAAGAGAAAAGASLRGGSGARAGGAGGVAGAGGGAGLSLSAVSRSLPTGSTTLLAVRDYLMHTDCVTMEHWVNLALGTKFCIQGVLQMWYLIDRQAGVFNSVSELNAQ